MCCNKHTDGYHGARKCVKCTGVLDAAALASTVTKDDGDLTDPEVRQREGSYKTDVNLPPRMPIEKKRKRVRHRTKIPDFVYPFNACVARPVNRREVAKTPAARAALQKEWDKLRKAGCWDESKVREYDDVVRDYKRKGKKGPLRSVSRHLRRKGERTTNRRPQS